MPTKEPFTQTEKLAHELAIENGLTWKEQVHLEAALNGLFYDLGIVESDMPKFVKGLKAFVNDVLSNVYED